MNPLRTIARSYVGGVQRHGNAKIHQSISPSGNHFMPFIMLDDLQTEGPGGGFPDHPHSGQQTISYILEGSCDHQDSNGSRGILSVGDLQFMKAGRGITHCEAIRLDPKTQRSAGLQIWVALPHANLNDKPAYSDVLAKNIKTVEPAPGVLIKVIAGESFGVKEVMRTCVPVHFLDITLQPGAKIQHPIPHGYSSFTHTISGTPHIANRKVERHESTFFSRDGHAVELENKSKKEARFLLLSGDPLDGQQVHSMGPFISTSREGLNKIILDYRMGRGGFKGMDQWHSDMTAFDH